jgi:hypothetical protein
VAAFAVRFCLYQQERNKMKHIATAALMFNLSVIGIYAQTGPNMPVSGTAAASTVSLRPGTTTSEYQLVGNSRLGEFNFRTVSVSIPSPQQPESCSGPNKLSLSTVAGAGVFRFADGGDLLTVFLTGGSDCIDLTAGRALCIRVFKITGGTGRLENAAGATLTLTMIVSPVLGDSANNPVFFAVTGTITGAIPGVAVQGGR